ncbi:hypothetical protein Clacol_000807 [Clathrus columnatus]|uniref:N-acetyltransferase domain-containing protein n=1 Tax=Clathrus columnatus TaxID=1419009 RepID=A0AAV4ZX83_9AGAM|nr:hypothetical protein Clacol_000807 [Clathrus columnatus]
MDYSTIEKSSTSTLTIKRPSVEVTPATSRDVPTLAHTYLLAFANNPTALVFSPQYVGVSLEELLRIGVPREINRLRQRIVGPGYSIKATVSTTNERGETVQTVVGFAHWFSPDGTRKRTFWEWFLSTIFYPIYNFLRPVHVPKGVPLLREMMMDQKEQVFGKGAEWEGKKFWHLRLLYVHPDWQGFGISSALLKWGFEKAQETNSPIYLESTRMGLPVYKAKGFKVVAFLPRLICGVHIEAPGMIWEPKLNVKYYICAPNTYPNVFIHH